MQILTPSGGIHTDSGWNSIYHAAQNPATKNDKKMSTMNHMIEFSTLAISETVSR